MTEIGEALTEGTVRVRQYLFLRPVAIRKRH
jgi:hypothetical protein